MRAATKAFLAIVLLTAPAEAQLARRRFDPEDLKLEQPGVVHADFQLAVIRGATAGRWVLPDYGFDFGLTPEVELGVDGSFALEGTPDAPFAWNHRTGDNIWLSSKMGLLGLRETGGKGTWALGLQLGPKVAVAPDAHGTGFEGLVLLGRSQKGAQLVLNVGAFVDPGVEIAGRRPTGLESGLDVEVALGDGSAWALVGDLSAVYFLSSQPHQLQTTFGPQWSAGEALDLSAQALIGIFPNNDRYGALLVVSPRVALFR